MAVTEEQLDEFLRQPPPREIPWRITWKGPRPRYACWLAYLFFSSLAVLMAYACVRFPPVRRQLIFNLSPHASAAGTLLAVRQIADVKLKGEPVARYAVGFTFTPAGGQPVKAVCYRFREPLPKSQSVVVEYLARDPSICQVQGCVIVPALMRPEIYSFTALLGLGYAGILWRTRRREFKMLAHGDFVWAKIEVRKAVGARESIVRGELVVTLSYELDGLPVEAKLRAGKRLGPRLAKKRICADGRARLLVDPARPRKPLIMDAWLA